MVVVNETDGRFYVGPSTVPGAGRGLFAKVPLAAGEKLEVIGVLVEPDSTSDICTAFANEHKLRFGKVLIIPVGFGGMVNHSVQPNMEKHAEGTTLYLRTTRPVGAGEELFFTYSDYARERFGLG
ncbi:MAG: SET domain-containing protein-lysine N-methyltransferase [Chloroflexi bacterium]|nr:SET domain-containing protein-lysine N-methyltransferase [Chloroflexota bacterium]